MKLIIILLSYFILINVLTYIIYTYDKRQAINKNYRVSEQYLLALVVIGGIFGAILSMIINRHKIRKGSFLAKYLIAIIIFIYLTIEYNKDILEQINQLILLI